MYSGAVARQNADCVTYLSTARFPETGQAEAPKPVGMAQGGAPCDKGEQRKLTGFQKRILEQLEGRALTATNLQRRLQVDRKRLYYQGLIPLSRLGLVKNDRTIGGYYRPDAPPLPKK
jgi:hypothetical protein